MPPFIQFIYPHYLWTHTYYKVESEDMPQFIQVILGCFTIFRENSHEASSLWDFHPLEGGPEGPKNPKSSSESKSSKGPVDSESPKDLKYPGTIESCANILSKYGKDAFPALKVRQEMMR